MWQTPQDENGNGTVRGDEDVVERAQARVDYMNAFAPDMVISLHFNGFYDPSVSGTEVYYPDTGSHQGESRRLAQSLLDALMRGMTEAGYTPVNRGVRSDRIKSEYLKYARLYGYDESCQDCTRLLVLGHNPLLFRCGQWPVGALVEVLFLSNPKDVAFLQRADALSVITEALHQGIRAYYQKALSSNAEPKEITQGATAGRQVALTFDCGPWVPKGCVEDILATLERSKVRATFFVTGQFIERYPDLFQRIAAHHELGNHSYSHPDFTLLSPEEQRNELQRTEELARALGYTTRPLWRAPFGARNPEVLRTAAEAGWPLHVFWTVQKIGGRWVSGDSQDWREVGSQQVQRNVLDAVDSLGAGTILLHHGGSPATAEALPAILAAIQERGYSLVPISALLPGRVISIDVPLAERGSLFAEAESQISLPFDQSLVSLPERRIIRQGMPIWGRFNLSQVQTESF
jgi:peptidoglycan/xylan/chitin deacetylase (PgdA/CDA1 family)